MQRNGTYKALSNIVECIIIKLSFGTEVAIYKLYRMLTLLLQGGLT